MRYELTSWGVRSLATVEEKLEVYKRYREEDMKMKHKMKDKPLKYLSENDVICNKVNSKYIDWQEKEIYKLQGESDDYYEISLNQAVEIKELKQRIEELEDICKGADIDWTIAEAEIEGAYYAAVVLKDNPEPKKE